MVYIASIHEWGYVMCMGHSTIKQAASGTCCLAALVVDSRRGMQTECPCCAPSTCTVQSRMFAQWCSAVVWCANSQRVLIGQWRRRDENNVDMDLLQFMARK